MATWEIGVARRALDFQGNAELYDEDADGVTDGARPTQAQVAAHPAALTKWAQCMADAAPGVIAAGKTKAFVLEKVAIALASTKWRRPEFYTTAIEGASRVTTAKEALALVRHVLNGLTEHDKEIWTAIQAKCGPPPVLTTYAATRPVAAPPVPTVWPDVQFAPPTLQQQIPTAPNWKAIGLAAAGAAVIIGLAVALKKKKGHR